MFTFWYCFLQMLMISLMAPIAGREGGCRNTWMSRLRFVLLTFIPRRCAGVNMRIFASGRRFSALLLFVLASVPAVLLSSTQTALAQTAVSGDLAGNVTDPSGAVIPNATVTLQNTGTGATQRATT